MSSSRNERSTRSRVPSKARGRTELPPDEGGYVRYAQGGFIWTDSELVPVERKNRPKSAGTATGGTGTTDSTGSTDNTGSTDPSAHDATPEPPTEEPAHESPSWSAKFAAYELPQALLNAATENDRVAARAHAARARNIEAARVATLHVEQNYPREEAAARTKTRGWTAAAIAERSFVTMVSAQLRISGGAAEYLVNTTRSLHACFEPTLQLLETGNTSYAHAQILLQQSAGVPPEFLTAYESELLPYAVTLTPPQFKRKAARIAAKFVTDRLQERHREALGRRELLVTPSEDGMADVHLYVDAVAATAILNRCSDAARDLQSKEEERSLTQLRADVATELLLTGTTCAPGTSMADALNLRSFDRFSTPEDTAATGKTGTLLWEEEFGGREGPILGTRVIGTGLGAGFTAQVSVQVPVLTLLEQGDEPAILDQYGPISLETAKLIMGSVAGFTRVLTDPETGTVLSVGTTRYKVPAAMRLWLMFRDGTCRFPGCTQPARVCEMDHTVDWQYGGETAAANLMCLCRDHHNVKHHTDWTPGLNSDGTAFWISPAGERYETAPAHYLTAA
jgi:hypothetical protein